MERKEKAQEEKSGREVVGGEAPDELCAEGRTAAGGVCAVGSRGLGQGAPFGSTPQHVIREQATRRSSAPADHSTAASSSREQRFRLVGKASTQKIFRMEEWASFSIVSSVFFYPFSFPSLSGLQPW